VLFFWGPDNTAMRVKAFATSDSARLFAVWWRHESDRKAVMDIFAAGAISARLESARRARGIC
jgi:hypothetical protein